MANEKRLIDIDETMISIHDEVWWTESEKAYFRAFLRKQKRVDAVEVVRCKDCKHQIEKGYAQYRYRWCNAWSGINGMGDEGFCNYGERKDNESNS